MSWLIRQNGRGQWLSPWDADRPRHKDAGGGDAGGDSGRSSIDTGAGFPSHDVDVLGSAERSITPAGTAMGGRANAPGEGDTGEGHSTFGGGGGPMSRSGGVLSGKASIGGIIGALLGAASPLPGGTTLGNMAGRSIQGGGAGPGWMGGRDTAGAGGRADRGGGLPGTAGGPSIAPSTVTTAALAQQLANLDPGALGLQMAQANPQGAIAAVKDLNLRLKLFQHNLQLATRASGGANATR